MAEDLSTKRFNNKQEIDGVCGVWGYSVSCLVLPCGGFRLNKFSLFLACGRLKAYLRYQVSLSVTSAGRLLAAGRPGSFLVLLLVFPGEGLHRLEGEYSCLKNPTDWLMENRLGESME